MSLIHDMSQRYIRRFRACSLQLQMTISSTFSREFVLGHTESMIHPLLRRRNLMRCTSGFDADIAATHCYNASFPNMRT
jgi:hypothetical protein